jgi:hypothetical protein
VVQHPDWWRDMDKLDPQLAVLGKREARTVVLGQLLRGRYHVNR